MVIDDNYFEESDVNFPKRFILKFKNQFNEPIFPQLK